jgi:hypothetical protein
LKLLLVTVKAIGSSRIDEIRKKVPGMDANATVVRGLDWTVALKADLTLQAADDDLRAMNTSRPARLWWPIF